jgi:hypothetical protein
MKYTSVFVIVQAGALKQLVVHRKTQGLDQVQLATRVCSQPNHVARIRWDLGMHQDDLEHVDFRVLRYGPDTDDVRAITHTRTESAPAARSVRAASPAVA